MTCSLFDSKTQQTLGDFSLLLSLLLRRKSEIEVWSEIFVQSFKKLKLLFD